MSAFPGAEPPLAEVNAAPEPSDVTYFSRVEGLVGEEAALLAVAPDDRTQTQRDRLHAIAADLDRIFDTLRERARRLTPERT
jgi:hypothetical protein